MGSLSRTLTFGAAATIRKSHVKQYGQIKVVFTFLVTADLYGAESIPYTGSCCLFGMQVSCLAGLEPRIHGCLRWPYLVSLPGKTEKAEKESNRVEPLEEAKRKSHLTSEGGREDRRARGMNYASL